MVQQDHKSHGEALPSMEEDYEQTILALKAEINKFWGEQRRLEARVANVTAENEQLSSQLALLSRPADPPPAPAAGPGDLRQQLQTLTKEKDSAVQLWRRSLRETERLEAALAAASSDRGQHRWRAHLQQVRTQYARALGSLGGELTRQRAAAERAAAELSAAREARRAADASCQQQRHLAVRLTQQLDAAGAAAAQQADQQQQLQQQLQQLQQDAAGSQQMQERASVDARQLQQQLLEARQRCVELSTREAEALRKLQEGVDVVQTALLEKQEAVQRADRLQDHAAELEAAVSRLAEEAGISARQQVDTVREQCNQRLAEMAAQLQQQLNEEVENQQAIERLQRENKKIEAEYERLKGERAAGGSGPPDALEQLTARLARLDDARIQAERVAADATLQLQAADDRHTLELQSQAENLSDQQHRLVELAKTCDDLRDQKRALTERLVAVQQEHQADMDAAVEKRRALEKTVSAFEQKLRQQDKELSREIESHETDHEHTKLELRQQLSQQQELTAKWRRELLTEAGQHRQQQQQLRAAERQLAEQLSQLQQQLLHSRQREQDAADLAKRYKLRVRELELRVQAAEKRFLTLHTARGGTAPPALLANRAAAGQLED